MNLLALIIQSISGLNIFNFIYPYPNPCYQKQNHYILIENVFAPSLMLCVKS